MPDQCTCGAQLPEDARFCHKCGKPQREEFIPVDEPVEVAEPVIAPPPVLAVAPAPINLSNRVAVRSALLACGVAILLSIVLGPLGLGLLALIAGGFFAVYSYRRRTGQPVSVVNGVRLGWIAGIFVFLLIAVITTLMVAALSQPEVAQQLREQMIKSSYPPEEVTRLFETLQKPSGIGLSLLEGFFSSVLLMGLGAAAGAKLLDRH
ncbi:MAG: zinc ribbon domain-containing protein [Acidobacteriota bacterium]